MLILSLLALSALVPATLSVPGLQQVALGDHETVAPERYLIEINPGETQWVTEDDKWALRRVSLPSVLLLTYRGGWVDEGQSGINFMDITATQDTYPAVTEAQAKTRLVKYPSKTAFNSSVRSLAKNLSKENMQTHLETFTSFYTRYYKSSYGIQSAEWLLEQVNSTIAASGADKYGASVRKFAHEWGQFSIIATIPGKSNKAVVIGAHQDSINLFLPALLAAPGADDDGSGTVTILEALRVLLQSEDVIKGKAENTIEFHWYSAEEGGLLGSQAIFSEYSRQGRDVRAMLQQDMTGYVARTLAAGEPESVGVITDFVDPRLTEFIKEVITTVSTIVCLMGS
jgi:leucyl aminopeptidase